MYSRCLFIHSSRVGDRVVLFRSDTQVTIVLNPTGSQIWELLEVPQSPSALAAQLVSKYPMLSADQAAADVASFLAQMFDNGFVGLET